jgi:pimeloyl-ACP methyl ester carboxylesterase
LILAITGAATAHAQPPRSCPPPSGTVPFEFRSGQNTLRGFIDLPSTRSKHPLILIVHGSGGTDVMRGNGGYNSSYDEMRAAFRRAGIATAVWDKAGSGCSEGGYIVGTPLVERTEETVAAFDHLKRRDDIDPARTGLWAISEGGWIAPMTAARRPEVAFLVVVSGPGRDAAWENQYYAFNRLIQLGVGKAEAEQAVAVLRRAYAIVSAGGSHEEFLAAIEPLERYPLFGRELHITETPQMKASPEAAAAYRVNQQARDYLLRADAYLGELRQPTLAIFGDRDIQVDWRTSVQVYKESFKRAHNGDLTIKIYPGAGHNLYRAAGPADEGPGRSQFVEGYLDLMVQWLGSRGFTTQR